MRPIDSWLILTMRYGADVRDPTPEEIARAVSDLKTHRDDSEHPNTWLRLGLSDGRVFMLDAYISGVVHFQEFADQDDAEPVSAKAIRGLDLDVVEKLFRLLAEGDVTAVNHAGWEDVV